MKEKPAFFTDVFIHSVPRDFIPEHLREPLETSEMSAGVSGDGKITRQPSNSKARRSSLQNLLASASNAPKKRVSVSHVDDVLNNGSDSAAGTVKSSLVGRALFVSAGGLAGGLLSGRNSMKLNSDRGAEEEGTEKDVEEVVHHGVQQHREGESNAQKRARRMKGTIVGGNPRLSATRLSATRLSGRRQSGRRSGMNAPHPGTKDLPPGLAESPIFGRRGSGSLPAGAQPRLSARNGLVVRASGPRLSGARFSGARLSGAKLLGLPVSERKESIGDAVGGLVRRFSVKDVETNVDASLPRGTSNPKRCTPTAPTPNTNSSSALFFALASPAHSNER